MSFRKIIIIIITLKPDIAETNLKMEMSNMYGQKE